jgi:hypothetical protein
MIINVRYECKDSNKHNRKYPEGMLFFPFCPLSRKEKGTNTQRPLRLERLPLPAGGVGGELITIGISYSYNFL